MMQPRWDLLASDRGHVGGGFTLANGGDAIGFFAPTSQV